MNVQSSRAFFFLRGLISLQKIKRQTQLTVHVSIPYLLLMILFFLRKFCIFLGLLAYDFFSGRHNCCDRNVGCITDFAFIVFLNAIGVCLFTFYYIGRHWTALKERKKEDKRESMYERISERRMLKNIKHVSVRTDKRTHQLKNGRTKNEEMTKT